MTCSKDFISKISLKLILKIDISIIQRTKNYFQNIKKEFRQSEQFPIINWRRYNINHDTLLTKSTMKSRTLTPKVDSSTSLPSNLQDC